jgi:predicted regulator of Ras-like GTPase activity (Roadblock/LC7/MglB family)
LLLWLALTDVFRARWTNQIQDEWIRAVLKDRPELQGHLERTRTLMNSNVRDSLVTGYEGLINAVTLPDPNDRHVVAAAVHCGASLIATMNRKDFPEEMLRPHGIEAEHPDDFIFDLFDLHPAAVVQAAANQRKTHLSGPRTVSERKTARVSRSQ